MGEFEAAFKLYHKTLSIRTQRLGELHDDTITSLKNLAYTYHQTKQYEVALEFYETILQSYLKKYGEHHIETVASLFHVGIANYNLRNNVVAMEYYEKSLALAKNLGNTELERDILQHIRQIAHTKDV